MSLIHHTALIDPAAQLHPTVAVGAYSLIGPQVQIGEGSTVGSHCVIEGHTRIGAHNTIHSYVALGGAPQDKKYAGEPTRLEIGERNVIREFCTLHRGTANGRGVTRVGDDNMLMAYVHLAHDCQVGSHTVFANNAQLAGHVQVGDWVILGGFTVVRQFLRLGAHSFTAMCALLFADLPPFVVCQGQPAVARNVNAEGLRRRGFGPERIAAVRAMYKALYRDNLTLQAAQPRIAALASEGSEAAPDVALMLEFLAGVGKPGIVRRRARAETDAAGEGA
ncbi:MAG: UDP-N-acetylglucosamine acyltransferase [Comamonadaceae bacterium BICA1-1]|nr:MAG: UDP-N-acetylglucosamine acyltransferase [Comamonadaceae bacterium BICA1-1]